jgi:hypothetical protein
MRNKLKKSAFWLAMAKRGCFLHKYRNASVRETIVVVCQCVASTADFSLNFGPVLTWFEQL